MTVAMMINSFPEALHQHPVDASYIARSSVFSIAVGVVGYLMAFWAFLVGTFLFARRSMKTVHRAARAIGIAFLFLVPIGNIPRFISGDKAGVVEIVVVVGLLIWALAVALRILWKGSAVGDRGSPQISPE
jgi:hypothetical protein